MNGTHRDAVGQPSKRGGLLAEKVRRGPIAEDRCQFGVKLRECRAKGALAGGVGAAPEVAGCGKRSMREKSSEAEFTHPLPSASSPDSPGNAGVLIGGAED
jgi:hypothetical protein